MKTKIAGTSFIHGLETWIPEHQSTMILCEDRTGPYVRIEDYRKLEDKLKRIERAETLTEARSLAIA